MKSLQKYPESATAIYLASDSIINVVREALVAVEGAKQKCLAAGQLLNDFKATLAHGEFLIWREKNLPEISADCCERWMRAAANIVRALPEGCIDVETISLSEVLSTPDHCLSAAHQKYKQAWLDFTNDKTIKECLNGVFVEGDEAHRVDRAINGKTMGGKGSGDRKDWSLFIGVKQNDMGAHLAHWKKMSAIQRSEIEQVVRGAILGDDVRLTRGQKSRLFKFEPWPEDFSRLVLETLKERLKGTSR